MGDLKRLGNLTEKVKPMVTEAVAGASGQKRLVAELQSQMLKG